VGGPGERGSSDERLISAGKAEARSGGKKVAGWAVGIKIESLPEGREKTGCPQISQIFEHYEFAMDCSFPWRTVGEGGRNSERGRV
jgi:hypothetical protein